MKQKSKRHQKTRKHINNNINNRSYISFGTFRFIKPFTFPSNRQHTIVHRDEKGNALKYEIITW